MSDNVSEKLNDLFEKYFVGKYFDYHSPVHLSQEVIISSGKEFIKFLELFFREGYLTGLKFKKSKNRRKYNG